MNLRKKIKSLLFPTVYEASLIANDKQMFNLAAMEMKKQCLHCTDNGINPVNIADTEVVVSLTTYSKRYYEVYLTIESIMQGTVKPNKIVLWLAEDMQGIDIPVYLQKQMARGLEIKYCKDIRSYKKLIPALKEYPNSIIVTVDDDVIYEPDVLEKLVNAYNRDKKHVFANRVKKIKQRDDGSIAKYLEWPNVKSVGASSLFFFTGIGGVLYPPHCFAQEVTNEDAFLSLAPCGDDIWFYAMALLNGYTVSKVFTHKETGNDFLVNDEVQDISLYHVNTEGELLNDKQINAVFEAYDIKKLIFA